MKSCPMRNPLWPSAVLGPENPNLPKRDDERERVTRGATVFSELGCAKCHDPNQGYTNNILGG